jgi:Domain of unknown function (DUF397)
METMDLSRAEWRTSSYSSSNGACVEVAVAWRRSTRSGSNGDCVEVAGHSGAHVLVRDTKNRGGPVLAFRPSAWRRFTGRVTSATS